LPTASEDSFFTMPKARASKAKSNRDEKDDRVERGLKEYRERKDAGEKVSMRSVAAKVGISPGTLSRRLSGKTGSKFGREPVNELLDDDLAHAVIIYCQRLDFIGSPARKDMITQAARRLLATERRERVENVKIGKNWTTRFIQAHPEFKVKKTTSKDLKRPAATDTTVFQRYFDKLGETVKKHGVQPMTSIIWTNVVSELELVDPITLSLWKARNPRGRRPKGTDN
jgi:AcrR family transcriptional regulator